MISHNLVDVFEVADRIFVLRLGRAAGDFKANRPPRSTRRARSPVSATDATGAQGKEGRTPAGEGEEQ